MEDIFIGVISDTHGLLRPEVLEKLQGCSLILHAGDVGKGEIIQELMEIAPVIAVRGNIDKDDWAKELHYTEVIEVKDTYIYLLHDLNQLDIDPKAGSFDVVISGHTHSPKEEFINGVLYLNPGSIGPKRFKLPISMVKLKISNIGINTEFFTLI
ncbi:metallophosphoesterase family protein [Alkaliphilus serpentinus]|uniref:Phosphoesterase n=1 Tax=Alkaliphilus serpentinus TaxID=1482731 RepID=A0A833HLZ6_9FIRM|nr:metallophosphoesterase family protein [Alkaliphilus serpentinus]KAB3526744.1 metallophosphoesterase family protein [Alkaliphilus serpentinus]